VERLLSLSPGRSVSGGDVERLLAAGGGPDRPPTTVGGPEPERTGTLGEVRTDSERAYILQKLIEYDWNISETARALNVPRSNLYKKIEKYQLNRGAR
jgi:two-component system nitrogen regulation response regulator NtrX